MCSVWDGRDVGQVFRGNASACEVAKSSASTPSTATSLGSTVAAKAKSSVNQTANRLKTALDADLFVQQATFLPDSAVENTRWTKVAVPGSIAQPVSVAALNPAPT
jgi:hypothetical protein